MEIGVCLAIRRGFEGLHFRSISSLYKAALLKLPSSSPSKKMDFNESKMLKRYELLRIVVNVENRKRHSLREWKSFE